MTKSTRGCLIIGLAGSQPASRTPPTAPAFDPTATPPSRDTIGAVMAVSQTVEELANWIAAMLGPCSVTGH